MFTKNLSLATVTPAQLMTPSTRHLHPLRHGVLVITAVTTFGLSALRLRYGRYLRRPLPYMYMRRLARKASA